MILLAWKPDPDDLGETRDPGSPQAHAPIGQATHDLEGLQRFRDGPLPLPLLRSSLRDSLRTGSGEASTWELLTQCAKLDGHYPPTLCPRFATEIPQMLFFG